MCLAWDENDVNKQIFWLEIVIICQLHKLNTLQHIKIYLTCKEHFVKSTKYLSQ